MEFETITFAPIDLDGIDNKYMTKFEIDWLNNYHAQVYEKLLLILQMKKENG